jgi:hypothetical protein
MLPTTLVPLLNVPAFYLGQQLTNIQFAQLAATKEYNIDTARLDAETAAVATYVKRTLDVASALGKIIDYQLAQFDSETDRYCKDRDGGKGPPVVVAFPAL